MFLVGLLVLFTSLVFAYSPCLKELKAIVLKPQVCGIHRFKYLECNLNAQIQAIVGLEPNQIAQLCRGFAHENDIELSILDATGKDMCILTNPTANGLALIVDALRFRSREKRREIYVYCKNYVGNPTFIDIPPVDSPDLDSVGLAYIYYYILYAYATYSIPINEGILQLLQYITQNYPKQAYNSDIDLNSIHLFDYIFASVPYEDAQNFINTVMRYTQSTKRFISDQPGTAYDTFSYLNFLLEYCTINPDDVTEFPLPIRVARYNEVRNAMMLAHGAASIQHSFAQFAPINTYSDNNCTYAYNLYVQDAKFVRVVMNQVTLIGKN